MAKKQLPHVWLSDPPWVKQINTIFQAFQVENNLKPKEHIYKQINMNYSNGLANRTKWTKFSMWLIKSTWENQSLTLT